jgi:hypothetical protein
MRLVKSKMNTFDWELRRFLLENCLGEENGVVQIDLAEYYGVKVTTIRASLKKIKTLTDTKIGMIGRLVFIPRTFDELVRGMRYSVSKTKSHMESDIMQNPSLAGYYHAMISKYYKKANKAPQGQLQIKFNGWERDSIDYYGERYGNDLNSENNTNNQSEE